MPFFSTVRMPLVVRRSVTQRFSVSSQKRCVCRFGRKRRRFLLLAWETRLPTAGFFPVISQTRDIHVTLREIRNLGVSSGGPARLRAGLYTSPAAGSQGAGCERADGVAPISVGCAPRLRGPSGAIPESGRPRQ